MIRIRLRRTGKKHHPFYRVVVANQPDKRDGAFLETLGSYDPHMDPPSITLNEERTRDWLGKGAQPSEAAEKILRRAGILGAGTPEAAVAVAEPPVKMSKKARAKAAAAAAAPPPAPAAAPAAVAPAAEVIADEAPAAEPAAAAAAPDEVGAEAPADASAATNPDGE